MWICKQNSQIQRNLSLKMKNSFIVVLLIYLEVTVAYDFTCPQPSQWRQRALQKCKTEKYHCLFGVNSEIFKELCKKSSFPLVEGVRAVLSEQISTDPCPKELYMPYIIATNESPNCIFYKSTCKEEGQMQCQIRSAAEDAACTCDYLDGYAFIHAPKHTQFCIPSEEDCSCYKKQCFDTEALSQDYICIPKPETCSGQYCHKMINPDSFRVISTNAEDAHPKFEGDNFYCSPDQEQFKRGIALPDIYNRTTKVLPKEEPDYRVHRPHPNSCGFLRQNVRILNEPICSVYTGETHNEQHMWWPSRTSDEPLKVPPKTKDTIYRDGYMRDHPISAKGFTRHEANPNTNAAYGVETR